MGGNSNPKKRGAEHYRHKQWIATKSGKEQHEKDVKRQRSLPVKPKLVK